MKGGSGSTERNSGIVGTARGHLWAPDQEQAARDVPRALRRQAGTHWLHQNVEISSLEEVGLVQDGPVSRSTRCRGPCIGASVFPRVGLASCKLKPASDMLK